MGRIRSDSELLNVQQAAELLGVNPGTIRRWAQAGTIEGLKVGSRGDWRFTKKSLLQMVRSGTRQSSTTPPSLSELPRRTLRTQPQVGHLVQFYEDEVFLLNSLHTFVDEALAANETCIVIAMKDRLVAIEKRLEIRGIDVGQLRLTGQYIPLDANETLDSFMIGSEPNAPRFFSAIGSVIARACSSNRPVRAFGEMVSILLAQGNPGASIELERLWNELAKTYEFSLYCAYNLHLFNARGRARYLSKVSKEHDHILPAESYGPLVDADARSRAVVLLQQKAERLSAEISERKQAEKALLLSEMRFKRLFQASADGMLIIDAANYRVLDVNPAAETLLDAPREDIVDKRIYDLQPFKECQSMRENMRQLTAQKVFRQELTLQVAHDKQYEVEVMASLYKEGLNKIIQFSMRDIAERRRAEQLEAKNVALLAEHHKLMELSVAKDEFISLASHQLRTPATGVKQYVGMVLDGYAGPITEEQKLFLQRAYENNERQLDTITDLLVIAKIDANQTNLVKEACNIHKLAETVIQDHYGRIKSRRQQIVLKNHTRNAQVPADESRLRMVLENLIDNASKYSREDTIITVALRRDRKYFFIDVIDQGVGIAQADLGKLFQKFSRIDNPLSIAVGGNGLGLYIAKKIVEAHGGTIQVVSRHGKDATFTIALPLR